MSKLLIDQVIAKAREEFETWPQLRHQKLTSNTGNLALVETRWLNLEDTSTLAQIRENTPEGVVVTELSRIDIDTGKKQRGYRFWSKDSERLKIFSHVTRFDFTAEHVYIGRFVPSIEAKLVPFEHSRDNGSTRELLIPGVIELIIGENKYSLQAFDDGGTLLLSFGDTTNRLPEEDPNSTYQTGRFLHIPTRLEPNQIGDIVLDFNKAFVPPCGFSDHFNCPFPPFSNRFKTAILAGEKKPIWHR